MSDKLLVDNNTHELKLGNSFDTKSHVAFHSIRYDFKPASVDTSKMSSLEVGEKHSVSLTVPHVAGSGSSHGIYKGNKRPNQKECVLIIDHKTGEFRLEKLCSTIQLKKTRIEGSSKAAQQAARPLTPVEHTRKNAEKSSPTNKNSSSSSQKNNHNSHSNSQRSSFSHTQEPFRELTQLSPSTRMSPLEGPPKMSPLEGHMKMSPHQDAVGLMSDNSGASSSDDDSSSDSEPEHNDRDMSHSIASSHHHHSNGSKPSFTSTLSEDLRLSESGSESD